MCPLSSSLFIFGWVLIFFTYWYLNRYDVEALGGTHYKTDGRGGGYIYFPCTIMGTVENA